MWVKNLFVYHLIIVISHHTSMTVRDKVQQQSPDGKVLLLEDLRRCLEMGVNTDETGPPTPGPPKVILLGHDMRGDFPSMKKAGIDISKHLHYAGCGDTYIWIEDTNREAPLSLSALVAHYGLAKCHYEKPLRKEEKLVFIGSHNAGNDAVMTMKLALAQALDQNVYSRGGKALDLKDPEWLDKPLKGMDAGMILLAYDSESATNHNYARNILNRTTEHGFAWIRLADVVGIAPGPNGVNWHPYVRARHWINKAFKDYKNQDFCVGNPHGFWKEYGKSLYYTDAEGPAPFQALFKELAGDRGVAGVAAAVANLTLGSPASTSSPYAVSTAQMKSPSQVPLPEKSDRNTNSDRPAVGDRAKAIASGDRAPVTSNPAPTKVPLIWAQVARGK